MENVAFFLHAKPLESIIWCSLQGEKMRPLYQICSISLFQYDEECCFSNMQRPRVSGICCSLQGAQRLPLYPICSSLQGEKRLPLYPICSSLHPRSEEAASLSYMQEPPRSEEAASLSYMQQPPRSEEAASLSDMQQPPRNEEAAPFFDMQFPPLVNGEELFNLAGGWKIKRRARKPRNVFGRINRYLYDSLLTAPPPPSPPLRVMNFKLNFHKRKEKEKR